MEMVAAPPTKKPQTLPPRSGSQRRSQQLLQTVTAKAHEGENVWPIFLCPTYNPRMKIAPVLVIAFALAAPLGQPVATSEEPSPALPTRSGIYVAGRDSQEGTYVRLKPSEVIYNRHTGNNFVRNSFYVNSRVTLDLKGPAAATGIPLGKASFLVPADPESPSLSLSRLALVRLQPEGDRRILAAMSANFLGGAPGRKMDSVAVNTEQLPGGDWVRVTPRASLKPGEYAIAYFPSDLRQFPDAVFDFRMNPDK